MSGTSKAGGRVVCSIAFDPSVFDELHDHAERLRLSFNEVARRAVKAGLAVLETTIAPEPTAVG